jgi:hypothetical protein
MNNDSLRVSFKTDETTILQDFFNKENISFNIKDDTLVAPINENEISPLISKIVNNNIQLREVKQLKTLEELFLDLTK